MSIKEKVKGVKKRISTFKKSREKRQAERRGMTVQEFRAHKRTLKRKEAAERRQHEEWQIEEKYRKKREAIKAGKTGIGLLDKLGDISKNVQANIGTQIGQRKPERVEDVLQRFGVLPGKPRRKPKKKKKKKKKRKRRR